MLIMFIAVVLAGTYLGRMPVHASHVLLLTLKAVTVYPLTMLQWQTLSTKGLVSFSHRNDTLEKRVLSGVRDHQYT